MGALGSVISLIVTILPGILGQAGVISTPIESLIVRLGAALPGLITSLAQGKGPTGNIAAILAALKSEIAALANSGVLSTDNLQLAASLNKALSAALEGYQEAEVKTDPDSLVDLPETL